MDQIQTQLDRISELSDSEVEELQNSVVSAFETVEQEDPSAESVDAMTTLADQLDTVRGELARREAQTEELAARAAEASARVKGAAAVEEEPLADPEAEVDTVEDVVEEEEEKPVGEASTITADASSEASTEEVVEAPEASEEFAVEAVESEVVEEAEAAVEDSTEASVEEVPEAEASVEEVAAEEVAPEAEAAVEENPATEASVEAPAEAEAAVEAPAEATAEAPTEAEASTTAETTNEPEAQEEAPVTAAAEEGFEAPADRRPDVQKAVAPVAITAGADIPGYTAGSTINDMAGVAAAFDKRLHSLRRVNGGDGEQHIVASLTVSYPEDRQLVNDAFESQNKIDALTSPAALTASGGHATPLEVRYDVFGLGMLSRPIRDSLPKFQADRGGIRFIAPPVLSAYDAAVGVWTNTTDTTPGGATKASLTVTGAAERTAVTDAVTLQLQVGNFFARAYPELLARHNELALIQHAREAELNIVSKIDAASTQVTAAAVLGVARDFLVQIKKAGAAYRSRHRISPDTQLRGIIPTWVLNAMSADLTMQMPGDASLGLSDSEVNAYLASSNITVTASPDLALFGTQGAGALLDFPTSFEWYLFAEGTFLFLDGGTLDLGIIRDSTLVGTNDYKMFVETFEGVAYVGTESLAITSTIKVSGEAAALTETNEANNPV